MRTKQFLRKIFVPLWVIAITMAAFSNSHAQTQSHRLFGLIQEPYLTSDSAVEKYRALNTGTPTTIDLYYLEGNTKERVRTGSPIEGIFEFTALPQGDYFLQIVAQGYLPIKKKISLTSDFELELKLREVMDLGSGPPPKGGLPKFAGAGYAFGCNVVSLIFVEFQGLNNWSAAERTNAVNAAESGMTDFETQAPPGAEFHHHVESIGTYEVTSAVGDTCGEAEAWVDEVLDQMGYTTGSVADRCNTLAHDRARAVCGNISYCQTCNIESSGFLFFISREGSNPPGVGGWNCSGTYQISYFGRSDEAEVYTHEIGHAFGTTDEYCTFFAFGPYCCGWPYGNWGCTATGGCLSQTNDNCDPLCGSDCDNGAPFLDCQDSCPAWNCTNHTACTMDGSGTTTFCNTSRRQIGWADTDTDGYIDCLETNCGTNPASAASHPDCLRADDVYAAADLQAIDDVAVNGNAYIGDAMYSNKQVSFVTLKNGEKREVVLETTTLDLLIDKGIAHMEKGVATVCLDPIYLQLVNIADPEEDLRVKLTPKGDCKGLYVSHKTADGFTVREQGAGSATIDFYWQIAAPRKDGSTSRMPQLPAQPQDE